jgi:uncharacterized membrane protein
MTIALLLLVLVFGILIWRDLVRELKEIRQYVRLLDHRLSKLEQGADADSPWAEAVSEGEVTPSAAGPERDLPEADRGPERELEPEGVPGPEPDAERPEPGRRSGHPRPPERPAAAGAGAGTGQTPSGAPGGGATATGFEAPAAPGERKQHVPLKDLLADALARYAGEDVDLETLIGGRWLAKLGIVVLVIGVALFLGYSLRYMGAAGRVATGAVTGVTLLAGGVALERRARYAIFARPLIGGGWALLYFTAYAAHNVEAARIITDPAPALALMGLIAVGMIAHSLRYRSEAVTGLAYFLAFLTVAISDVTAFTLGASVILAVSLVAVLRTTRWYGLALFGVAATYVNHLLWLGRAAGTAGISAEQGFWVGQGMLIVYWLVFTAFDFLARREGSSGGRLAVTTNVTNTVGFLGLSWWQVSAVFPDARYLLAGLGGAAYVATSYLLYFIRRRALYRINAVVAGTLVAAAVFLRLDTPAVQSWLGLAWMLEATVILGLGLRLREPAFRVQAWAIAGAAVIALLARNLYGDPGVSAATLWVSVVPAVVLLYLLFARLPGRLAEVGGAKWERTVADIGSWAATALAVVLLWRQLPSVGVALAWAAAGLLLFEAGDRFRRAPLRAQGHALAGLAVGRLFLANFTAVGSIAGLSHRLLTVVPVAAVLYYLWWTLRDRVRAGRAAGFEARLPVAYSWAGAIVLVVLARFELGRAHTVLGWTALALVLLALGLYRRDRDFRLQSYVLAGLVLWRGWSTNFYLTGTLFGLPERIATTVPVLAGLYGGQALGLRNRAALASTEAKGWPDRIDARGPVIFSLAATLLLTVLLFYEVRGNLLTIAWTVEGFALLAAGFALRERTFRVSGLGLLLVCLLKVFLIDLRGMDTLYRILSFIVLGVILLVVSFGYTRYREIVRRYM